MPDNKDEIRWQISLPIFKNRIILRQLLISIGLPFGLVGLVIVLGSGKSVYAIYGLGLIGILLFFTWFLVMMIYGGKYEAEYMLNKRGILCRTQAKQTKKNRIVNALTVVLGFLSGNPAVAGAGMLAQSQQEVFLKWNRLTKVRYKPKSHTILLRGGWMEQIALFCTAENYSQVEHEIMLFTRHSNKS